MKRLVKEKKDRWWRALCEDSGLDSPLEVVHWARKPCVSGARAASFRLLLVHLIEG